MNFRRKGLPTPDLHKRLGQCFSNVFHLAQKKEESLIPWRKFVSERNWRGKPVDEKNSSLCFFSFNTQKNSKRKFVLDENVFSTQVQADLSAVTDVQKEFVGFLIVCFFTVCVKIFQLCFFVNFIGGIESVWFCKGTP